MKKIDGVFKLSNTDRKRIAARCRSIARAAAFNGEVEAVLNRYTGDVSYQELVGSSYLDMDTDAWECVYTAKTNVI